MNPYQFLSELLVTKYGVQPHAVRPEATVTELGLDSLTLTELLFDLENEFGIEVPEERADFSTLGEAAALIDELIRAKPA